MQYQFSGHLIKLQLDKLIITNINENREDDDICKIIVIFIWIKTDHIRSSDGSPRCRLRFPWLLIGLHISWMSFFRKWHQRIDKWLMTYHQPSSSFKLIPNLKSLDIFLSLCMYLTRTHSGENIKIPFSQVGANFSF